MVTTVRRVEKVARLIDAYRVERRWPICSEGYYPPGIVLSFRRSVHGPALVTVAGVVNGTPGAACEPTEYLVRERFEGWLRRTASLLQSASKILHRPARTGARPASVRSRPVGVPRVRLWKESARESQC